MQSVWFPGRGAQKEMDEAKLRFAAAEVPNPFFVAVFGAYLFLFLIRSCLN